MRRSSRPPLLRLARGVLAAGCLAVIALAVAGTVEGELGRRRAQDGTLRLRQYTTVNALAASQQKRLASGGAGAARRAGFTADAQRTTNALRRLKAHSHGREANTVAALQRSYASALRQTSSGRQAAKLRTALTTLQTTAQQELRADQASRLETADTSPLGQAELAATALIVVAALLGLLRLGLLRLPRPSREEAPNVQFEELRSQARTDSLTQLGNHRAFHHDLSTEIARRAATGSHFTLMAVDLDGLKQINDTKGHPAGDAHIKVITQCLQTVIGSEGTIYRTGGDEFMVIVPNRRNWDALILANKVDHATRQLAKTRAVSIGVTESTRPREPAAARPTRPI